MKRRENFFCAKKTKQRFHSTIKSPLLQCSAILENIHWMQAAYSLVCQPRHKDTTSTLVYALNCMKTAHPCGAADTLLASSGYSPKWRYADTEETIC